MAGLMRHNGARLGQESRQNLLRSAAPRRAATLRPELEQGWVERSHRGFWGNLRPDELIPEPILDDPRISPEVTWQAHSLRGAPTAGNAVAAAAFPWVLYDRLCAYPGRFEQVPAALWDITPFLFYTPTSPPILARHSSTPPPCPAPSAHRDSVARRLHRGANWAWEWQRLANSDGP
ncbi:hypothetical protein O3P69_007709 [Scylla paramamosain]|uniref:Uncharacterized protein n=1 Tax=Scylla paramamosain TaxID=85552 RepID=A0AAW0UWX7_SCYPA